MPLLVGEFHTSIFAAPGGLDPREVKTRPAEAVGEFLSRTVAISRNKATTFLLLLYARPVLNGKNGMAASTGFALKSDFRLPAPQPPELCIYVCVFESKREQRALDAAVRVYTRCKH